MVFTRLGDRVTVRPASSDRLSITGRFADGLATGPDNLVIRARDAFREAVGVRCCGPVAMFLEKQLPVAAGIGGGSADAAAALRALARLWQADLSDPVPETLAPRLGADVPMCLSACPVLASGTGEMLRPVGGMPELSLVLANPGVPWSTPEVFGALLHRDSAPLPELGRRPDRPVTSSSRDAANRKSVTWSSTSRKAMAGCASSTG